MALMVAQIDPDRSGFILIDCCAPVRLGLPSPSLPPSPLQEVARIGYSVHLLQLAPPPAWSLAYLQAATRAVTPVLHPRGRPPPAGNPLTCRQVADLMVGAACASRPWHRMLRQREEGAERGQVTSPTPMGRPVQPSSPPASALLDPAFSPLAVLPAEARPLSAAREPPFPNNVPARAPNGVPEAHAGPDVQPDMGGTVPASSKAPPGSDPGGLDSAIFPLGSCPAPSDESDGDELYADGKAGSYWEFEEQHGEDAAGSGSSSGPNSSGLRASGLSLAAQFAEAAEPLVLEHAGRMIPADVARCLEAYWRLGRPASQQLLGVVQYRGGALLRVCNPNQSNAIIQVSVVGMACSDERYRASWQQPGCPASERGWCSP